MPSAFWGPLQPTRVPLLSWLHLAQVVCCFFPFPTARYRKRNVIGGHVVATLVGLLLRLIFPNEWWAVAIAVGLAIGMMAALRITHPPAGADPLVVFSTDPGFGFLLFPVLTGAIALVCVATAFHKLTRTAYPTGKS